MEIAVGRRDLEKAMALASLALGPSSADDFTRLVLVRVSESGPSGRIDLITSTGKLGSRVPILVETDLPVGHQFAIEGWRLKQWVASATEEVIRFRVEDKSPVRASTSRGSVMLPAFDPGGFKNWETMASPMPVPSSKVDAKKLHSALSYAKSFVGESNPTNPGTAVLEVSQGTLRATDLKALAIIEVEEISRRNLRIHGKDVGAFLSFLAAVEGEVELQDHALFLVAETEAGEVFVVIRPSSDYEFPTINISTNTNDPYWVEIDPSELRSSITSLIAGAEREDHLVNLKLRKSEDLTQEIGLVVGMRPVVPSQGVLNEVRVGCFSSGGTPDAVPFPKSGVEVDYHYLNKLVAGRKERIRLGFHVMIGAEAHRKNGWVQMREERDGYRSFTLVKWARSVEDLG